MAPPDALAWYGAVGTTTGLLSLISEIFAGFTSISERASKLKIKIEDDLSLLKKLMETAANLTVDDMTSDDASVFRQFYEHLQPFMTETELSTRKVWKKIQDAGILSELAAKPVIDKLEAAEHELKDFVGRIHLRICLLSPDVKLRATSPLTSRDQVMHLQNQMQQIANKLGSSMSDVQSMNNHQSLWLADEEQASIEYQDHNRSRRRMATLGDGRLVIVELVPINSATSTENARRDLAELGLVLNHCKPSVFNLLRCIHIFHNSSADIASRYGLIFELPQDYRTCRNLVEILTESARSRSYLPYTVAGQHLSSDVELVRDLGQRIHLACQLAESVYYLHSFSFVHQSIRSTNLLISINSQTKKPRCFLAGFERCRPNAGASNQRRSDADWRNNIYRSPERVAATDDEELTRHTISHDIYSLGVVLLELGLCQPLIEMKLRFERKNGDEVRRNLQDLANTELPERASDGYTDVVRYCLESRPESALSRHLVAVGFLENVLMPLYRLRA